MERVNYCYKMVTNLKDHSRMVKKTVMVNLYLPKVRFIKDNGKKINRTDKVNKYI